MSEVRISPKVIEEKCSKAGISFWLASEVALALQPQLKPGLGEEELNDLILIELKKRDEESSRTFENYHKVYVRTSDGILGSFNKERIVKSLVKETTLAQNVCREIASEVENDIRRLELRYISAPLIREMINSKLLERRNMRAKTEYMRLGLPIYDVTKMIENARLVNPPNPEALHKSFGDAVATEYALIKLLPEEVSKAHLTGAIHVHDLPYFATRPISLQNDLRAFLQKGVLTDGLGKVTSVTGPAKHPDVAISHAVRVLISGGTHLSGGQSFDFFNTFLAPYTINCSEKQVGQIIQTFLYELNQIYAVKGGKLAQSTLNFELETPLFLKKEKAVLPKGITTQDTYNDYEREAVRFLNIFLQTMSDGDFKGKAFTLPKIVLKVRDSSIPFTTEQLLDKFLEKNELTIVNLRGKQAANTNLIAPNQLLSGKGKKWFNTMRTGVLQEVSINLPRIALSSKDDSEFFNQIDDALSASGEACKAKKEVIEKRLHKDMILPFLTQQFNSEEYYSLDNAQSIVNVIGLDNAVKEYTGNEINKNSDAFGFADRVLAYITRKIENHNENEGTFLTFGCLDVKMANARFASLNERRFGIKDVFPTRGFTHPLQEDAWIETEAKLQAYCAGAAKLVLNTENATKTIYSLLKKDSVTAFSLQPQEAQTI